MAIIDVTISQLSESVAEATLLNWKKNQENPLPSTRSSLK